MVGLMLLACGPGEVGDDTGAPVGPEFVEGEPASLALGPVVTCADPAARLTDGPMYSPDVGPEWAAQPPVGWEGEFYYSEGIAVADLTGDGLLDILLPEVSIPRFYVAQADGTYVDEAATRLPAPVDVDDPLLEGNAIASVVDLDWDGDLDVLMGRGWYPHRLLRNDDGVFADVTGRSGVATEVNRIRSAAFADIDGDDDLDLHLANDRYDQHPPDPGHPDFLLENTGAGFADISSMLTDEDSLGYTKLGAFFDADGDVDQDLLVINHFPEYQGNRFLRNDGAGLLVDDPTAGLDIPMSGMGLGIGDLNGDGLPDLLFSDISDIWLLETLDGTWYDSAAARGLIADPDELRIVAWGGDLVDMDNDGLLDVVMAFGEADSDEGSDVGTPGQPDALWLQDADGQFVQVADEWGVADTNTGRGVAAVDLDGDGWLDLVKRPKDAPAVMYRSRCGEAAWTQVALRQAGGNPDALGARVVVTAGGRSQTEWVRSMGRGYGVSLAAEAHFGLGAEETYGLVVWWPDGTSSEIRDVPARRRILVERG